MKNKNYKKAKKEGVKTHVIISRYLTVLQFLITVWKKVNNVVVNSFLEFYVQPGTLTLTHNVEVVII